MKTTLKLDLGAWVCAQDGLGLPWSILGASQEAFCIQPDLNGAKESEGHSAINVIAIRHRALSHLCCRITEPSKYTAGDGGREQPML